jgi:HNH endonuclease
MKRRPCPDMREHREAVSAYVLPRIVETPSGCWEWQKYKNQLGYAEGGFRGRTWIITRLIYCATMGGFDPQLDVCHTCDNPGCVNPTHLWVGSRRQNSRDCIEKGRHYKLHQDACPRGHVYAENGGARVDNRGWRNCKVCERARGRIAAGWPEDLAYSEPARMIGRRRNGFGKSWRERRAGKGIGPQKRTHCKRGHLLAGDNIYPKPGGGRQCKICHDAAAAAWIARGKVPLSNATT